MNSFNFETKKQERTSTQVFALLAALALSALLASGCSTPVVSGNTAESSQSSYGTCLRVLTPQGRGTQCDTVTNPYGVFSYSQYTYSKSSLTVSKSSLTSQVGSKEMEAAYEAYLQSLDPDVRNELNEQWEALASSN